MLTPRTGSWLLAAVLAATASACSSGATAGSSVAPASSTAGSTSAAAGPATVLPPADNTLPSVSGARGSKPAVVLPAGNAPKSLQVDVLDEGAGAVVTAGQQISVDYVGVVWPGGAQFDASYDRGQPATFGIGIKQVIVGWDEGLVGQKVGSRVLLVVPPDKGYGANGNPRANIKGTDTLVFVVDILAAK